MWKKLEGSFVSLLFAGTAFIGAWWGAHAWLPSLASRHGAGIDAMLNYLLLTTGVLFVTGYVVLAYFIWKGSRRDAIGPRFASRRTEHLLSAGLGLTMAAVA
jgi:heme/copper-type cytochrome/quinol oxidase subunit 2